MLPISSSNVSPTLLVYDSIVKCCFYSVNSTSSNSLLLFRCSLCSLCTVYCVHCVHCIHGVADLIAALVHCTTECVGLSVFSSTCWCCIQGIHTGYTEADLVCVIFPKSHCAVGYKVVVLRVNTRAAEIYGLSSFFPLYIYCTHTHSQVCHFSSTYFSSTVDPCPCHTEPDNMHTARKSKMHPVFNQLSSYFSFVSVTLCTLDLA